MHLKNQIGKDGKMDILTVIILVFAALAAIDYIFGNKLGLGGEFSHAFMLLGTMALSMIGMIVMAPKLAELLSPVFVAVYDTLGLDPSIIPASLFACDMGGAPLASSVAMNREIGQFNALVVSSMMGATVSFTVPFALEIVKKEQHRELIFGLLCGIVTIPVGCFVSGVICGLNIVSLIKNLLPLVIFSIIIASGLVFAPNASIKIFKVIGVLIKALIVVGLLLGMLNFLTKKELVTGLATVEEGIIICLNASIVMSGMLPMIYIISKLLSKPLGALGDKIGINKTSALGLFSSLATSFITFGVMKDMDKRGVALNCAFAVSAAFTFAEHLAFTMAFDAKYILPMIVGKLVSGACALVLTFALYNKFNKKDLKKDVT